jgi:hypothetical protein
LSQSISWMHGVMVSSLPEHPNGLHGCCRGYILLKKRTSLLHRRLLWHPLLAFELILAIKIYFPDLFGGSEHSRAIPAIHPTHLHKRHLKN